MALDKRYIYAFLFASGLLNVFSFAPFFIWPIYAISIIIFILSLDAAKNQKNYLRALFWRGWVFGFGLFLISISWIGSAFLVDAEKFLWLMPFALTALPACNAVLFGIAGVLYGLLKNKNAFGAFWFAACLGFTEFLRGHIFTGFPWNFPAYIFKAGGIISQSSFIIGIYSVSLFIVFIFASFAKIGEKHFKKVFTIAICSLAIAQIYGALRLNNAKNEKPSINAPIIATGQGGFTQKQLFNQDNILYVANTYLSMLDSDAVKKANIIVWPEGTFPFLALEEPELIKEINRRLNGKTLIFGAVRREIKNGDESYFNSIVFLKGSPQGAILENLYNKYHLVPFGEYLPFKNFLNSIGISSLVSYGTDFHKGIGPSSIKIIGAPATEPRLCYEAVFPNIAPKTQSDWIVSVSVDAWFGDMLGPDQHYNQAKWIAIEAGKPLIRSASGGWSGIVNSYGQTIVEMKSSMGMVSAQLPPKAKNPVKPILKSVLFTFFLLSYSLLVFLFGNKSNMCLYRKIT